MKNIFVIANPSSGGKKGMNIAERLIESFKQKDLSYKLYETTGQDNFKTLTQDFIEDGFDTVAIIGGDGTISEYVKQIAILEVRPDILLLPLGTTNNLARALETELDKDKLLKKVASNQVVVKQSDVGKVNEDYFISTLSAGSLPEVAWKTDDEAKEAFGSFGYVLEGLSALNDEESFDINIQTETEEIQINEVTLLVIGLSNSVFGIPTFFEDAKLNDGELHLYALKASSLIDEASSLGRNIFPKADASKNLEDELSYTTSFNKASLNASTDLNLAVDGEKGPVFPIELAVLHNHLTFLVPETDK